MKISELTALLTKVQQIAGDVEVTLEAAADKVETIITDLGVHLDPADPTAGSKLTIEHGEAPPPAEPTAEPEGDASGTENPAGT